MEEELQGLRTKFTESVALLKRATSRGMESLVHQYFNDTTSYYLDFEIFRELNFDEKEGPDEVSAIFDSATSLYHDFILSEVVTLKQASSRVQDKIAEDLFCISNSYRLSKHTDVLKGLSTQLGNFRDKLMTKAAWKPLDNMINGIILSNDEWTDRVNLSLKIRSPLSVAHRAALPAPLSAVVSATFIGDLTPSSIHQVMPVIKVSPDLASPDCLVPPAGLTSESATTQDQPSTLPTTPVTTQTSVETLSSAGDSVLPVADTVVSADHPLFSVNNTLLTAGVSIVESLVSPDDHLTQCSPSVEDSALSKELPIKDNLVSPDDSLTYSYTVNSSSFDLSRTAYGRPTPEEVDGEADFGPSEYNCGIFAPVQLLSEGSLASTHLRLNTMLTPELISPSCGPMLTGNRFTSVGFIHLKQGGEVGFNPATTLHNVDAAGNYRERWGILGLHLCPLVKDCLDFIHDFSPGFVLWLGA